MCIRDRYKIDPLFGFYCLPKGGVRYFFYLKENVITVGKVKWGCIVISELKTVNSSIFNPHNYGLTTELDIKQLIATKRRMAINQAKHKQAKEKGFVDLQTLEPPQPSE